MVSLPQITLVLDVCFLVEPGVQLKHCAAELDVLLFTEVQVPLKVVDECLKVYTLSFHLSDMVLSFSSHLTLERLHLCLERLDFSHQLVLELYFHPGVFLEIISQLDELVLELLSGRLTISDELLVLSHILLQIIKDL